MNRFWPRPSRSAASDAFELSIDTTVDLESEFLNSSVHEQQQYICRCVIPWCR